MLQKKIPSNVLLTACCIAAFSSPAVSEGLGGLSQAIDTPRPAAGQAQDLAIILDYREDYRALSFGFQPSERSELGISFPTYDDGDGSSSGNELSFAYRLLNEGAYTPSLTAGLAGLGSDDRGSGEYVVAGKTFGNLSAAVGLGWGRYADPDGVGRGDDDGTFRTDHLFAGETEPFANLVWSTGLDRVTIAAEFSGISGPKQDDTYAGVISYEIVEGFAIAALVNNQGSAGLRLSFEANPDRPFAQANIGRGPHPYVENTAGRANRQQPTEAQVLAVLQDRMEKEDLRLSRFAMAGDAIDVTVSSPTNVNFANTTGRVARILSATAPANISTFRITQNTGAFDSNVIVLDRAGLDTAIGQPDAGALAWSTTHFEASPINRPDPLFETEFEPRFSYGFTPSVKADFVTSDNLELTATLLADARYTFSPQTFVAGALGYRLLNQWTQEDPPEEPGIRSDITSYTPDEIYLQSLTARHRFRLAPTLYSRVSAGLFERAYGGVSGEVIWRNPEQNYALGVEATYAIKRSYEDWFGFEDADATTVIGTLYANIGQSGDFVNLSAGQYLAGDFGVGMTVGRNYANGWQIAASTQWSEETDDPLKFGARVTIPMAWAGQDGGKDTTNISVGGQSGDFGSRVSGTGPLYSELRASDKRRLEDAWGEFWN